MEKEEVFAELLDDYLDIKAMNEKVEYDNKEIAKEEKELEILKGLSDSDTITIYNFLRNYLHTRTLGSMEMTLTSLKYLGLPSSYVMAVHDNFAKNNPELVHQGYLVMVKDPNHNRATYINPVFINRLLKNDELEAKLQKFSTPQAIDLEDLADYYEEYQELLNKKEINNTTYDVIKKTHKIKKFNMLKEKIGKSDNND